MVRISLKKQLYRERLERYLEDYTAILIVNVDNVGSKQIQQIRIALREPHVESKLLLGKNTTIRHILRDLVYGHDGKPELAPLLDAVKGNVGFVFTNQDPVDVGAVVRSFRLPTAARVGIEAPEDVWLSAGSTNLGPERTSFFAALQISTKIVRGAVEIQAPFCVVRKGEKVSASATALLGLLDMKPFSYGCSIVGVFDPGFHPSVFRLPENVSEEHIMAKFASGVRQLAAISMAAGHSNAATVPHQLTNCFNKLLAVSVATGNVEECKLLDPGLWQKRQQQQQQQQPELDAVVDSDSDSDSDSDFSEEAGDGGLMGLFDDSDSE